MDRIQPWAPAVARVALGLVLLWFGIHELIQPSLWTGYVPAIPSTSHLALALVLAHGWALSVLGVALSERLFSAEEAREGISAFKERRPPSWSR